MMTNSARPASCPWSNEVGLSLISMMVAVGIAGILAMVMAQRFANDAAAQQDVEIRSELLGLQRYLLNAVDCTATAAAIAAPCTIERRVDLKSSSLTMPVLVSSDSTNPTKIGLFTLRATCVGGGKLLVEAAKFQPGSSSFSKNPLTGKDLSWRDVNRGIPFPCLVP